jgi:hypothetical protein
MKSKRLWALFVGLVGVAICSGIALATPPSGVTNPPWSPVIGTFAKGIEASTTTDTGSGTDWQFGLTAKGWTDVYIVENVIAPGGTFGWHSHPGPSLVIVKSGTLSAYHAPDCKPMDYGPGSPNGSTFIDEGHDLHMVRNNSTTDIADVYVVSFVPAGWARRIDESNPNPSICPTDPTPGQLTKARGRSRQPAPTGAITVGAIGLGTERASRANVRTIQGPLQRSCPCWLLVGAGVPRNGGSVLELAALTTG